jgi:hypothetical protein
MPRDARLYMTFPNDFPWHPKVLRLSAAAKWAFVEMNGHSRINDLDGRIPAADAEFMWNRKILDALVNSHPTRPLVVRDGDDYVIRDYAEHQQTKAQREELHEKRAAAGAAGAAAREAKRQASAKQVLSKPKQTEAELEIELEITTTPNGVVEDAPKRAHSIRPDFTISQRMREWASEHTPLVDIDATLPEFIDYWRGVGKPMKDWESVWHNGMRKQQGFAERDGARSRGGALTRTEQNMAAVARIAAQEAAEQKGIAS